MIARGYSIDGDRWVLDAEVLDRELMTSVEVTTSEAHRLWGTGSAGPPRLPGRRMDTA